MLFGNDVLTGNFCQERYNRIDFRVFEPYGDQVMMAMVTATYAARARLVKSGRKGMVARDPGPDQEKDPSCIGRARSSTNAHAGDAA